MKILKKIKNFLKNQTKIPKKIEISQNQDYVQDEDKHEDFAWILHNKNDLTVEEVTDIEMLLEEEL